MFAAPSFKRTIKAICYTAEFYTVCDTLEEIFRDNSLQITLHSVASVDESTINKYYVTELSHTSC